MIRYPQLNYKALATAGLASLVLNVLPITAIAAYGQSSDDPNQGLPPGTVGGGSRGGSVACSVQTPLVAFMPDTNVLKTLDTDPSLWVYLPNFSSFETAELVFYDENETAVIDTVFPVANQSGLMKISLDAIAQNQPLDSHQSYRWFLSLVCPNNRAADVSVDGWLQLTPLSTALAHQLGQTTNPIEQANLYLTAGMWSEALTTLIRWQESPSPDITQQAWTEVIATLSPVTTPLNFTTAYRLRLEAD